MIDYSIFKTSKKKVEKVKTRKKQGVKHNLNLISKIRSNGKYRYFAIQTKYLDNFQKENIIKTFVKNQFSNIGKDESIMFIKANRNYVVRERYFNPSF